MHDTNAGMQLANTPASSAEHAFGKFPNFANVMVIAGNCGKLNPALDADSDGVLTVEETRLTTPHQWMVIVTVGSPSSF